MKFLLATCVVVSCVHSASAQQLIPGDDQFFSPQATAAIRSLNGTQRWVTWPEQGEFTARLAANQLPVDMRSDAALWVSHILKEDFVLPAMQSALQGFRQRLGQDVLGARYRYGSVRVQVLERPGGLEIVINDGSSSPMQGLQNFVLSQASCYLKLPDGTIEISIRGEGAIRTGQIVCAKRDQPHHQNWWNNITFVTDGSTVAFSVGKSLASAPPTLFGATNSRGKRFPN